MANAKLFSFVGVILVLMATSSLLLVAEARLLKEEAFNNDGEVGSKQLLPSPGVPGFPGFPFPPFPFPFPPIPWFPHPPFLPPLPVVPGVPLPPITIPILPPKPPSLSPATLA